MLSAATPHTTLSYPPHTQHNPHHTTTHSHARHNSQTLPPTPPPPRAGQYEEATAFTDFANWLIPGRVMLGRYPFVEPSRCRSRTEGEAMIRQLIAAGTTTFVCLQASCLGRRPGAEG